MMDLRFLAVWLLKMVARLIKWLFFCVVLLEVTSFCVLHASHYFVYGHLRDYNYTFYDPYTLFRYRDGVRPTVNNSEGGDSAYNRKIWLFGGSTMRGQTDYDERTIPSILAGELNRLAKPYHFQLTNFGEPAFNSLLEVKYLEKALIENTALPELILFYDGINDCIFLCQYRHPEAHYGMRRMKALIENYRDSFWGIFKPFNAYIRSSFTKELYDKMHQVLFRLDEHDPLLVEYLDHLEQRYDFVARLCSALGVNFVVVWQPMFWAEECENGGARDIRNEILGRVADNTALRHNYSMIYRAVGKRLAGRPYFVDMKNELCGTNAPVYQPDGIHLRDEGRRVMAGKIRRIAIDRLQLPAAIASP